jgi:hypothetical protein
MATEESRVIVTAGTAGHANQAQCHHRDFPEIRAEGEHPQAAAAQLVNHLTRALDSALTPWRRETIEKAIAEVQEFHKQQTPPA